MINFKTKKSYRVAIDGIIAALAIALSFLESLIPDMAFLPPGAKLGLSNIAVMFAVMCIGFGDGLCIAAVKSGFVLFTRGLSAFFMSFAGGLLSCIALIILTAVCKKRQKEYSYIGVSVICAVMHNIGQLAAASLYLRTNLLSAYLPMLLICGIFAGMITGVVLKTAMPAITKLKIGVEKI